MSNGKAIIIRIIIVGQIKETLLHKMNQAFSKPSESFGSFKLDLSSYATKVDSREATTGLIIPIQDQD